MERHDINLPVFTTMKLSDLWSESIQPEPAMIMSDLQESAQMLMATYLSLAPWAQDDKSCLLHFWESLCGRDQAHSRTAFFQIMLNTVPPDVASVLVDPISVYCDNISPIDGMEKLVDKVLVNHSCPLEALLRKEAQMLFEQHYMNGNLQTLDEAIVRLHISAISAKTCPNAKFGLHMKLMEWKFVRYKCSKARFDIDQAFWHFGNAVSCLLEHQYEHLNSMHVLGRTLGKAFRQSEQLIGFDTVVSFLKQVYLVQVEYTTKAELLDEIAHLYCLKGNVSVPLAGVDETLACQKHALQLSPEGRLDNPSWMSHFGWDYYNSFQVNGNPSDIDQAIVYISQANLMLEDEDCDKPTILNRLSIIFRARFEFSGQIPDVDEAISHQLHCLNLPGVTGIKYLEHLMTLNLAYNYRYIRLHELADLEHCIRYCEERVSMTPDEAKAHVTLGVAYRNRYNHLKTPVDLEKAIACHVQSLSLARSEDTGYYGTLTAAAGAYHARFKLLGDVSDLETALMHQLQVFKTLPEGHPYDRADILYNLGCIYFSRFQRSHALDDINESVRFTAEAVNRSSLGWVGRSELLANLGWAYLTRYQASGNLTDLDDSMKSFEAGALAEQSPHSDRFKSAHNWAHLCEDYLSPSASLRAHKIAMSLLPRIAWIGASVKWRYNQIATQSAYVLQAPVSAIKAGEYGLALEWLEQGRSIVWKQLLQLRAPLEELRQVDPVLANRLEQATLVLEGSDTHNSQSFTESESQMMLLERMAQRRRRAADEWDELVEQARSLPGLDSFMRLAKKEELFQSATFTTPIVLFARKNMCSALIISKTSRAIEHISLSSFNERKATLASRQIKELLHTHSFRGPNRKFTNSNTAVESQERLRRVLTTLWFDVVQPILSFLKYTSKHISSELPRITWCCTGSMLSLPLHAAGDYTTRNSSSRTFNYAISSYTPNLTSLIPSSNQPSSFTGIFAVSQSHTSGQSDLPGSTEELGRIVKLAEGLPVTQVQDEYATQDSVAAGMERHSWIHLACHASQYPQEPLKSAFILHNSQLNLQHIMEKQIKPAEFAFLSACQTATGDESVPDEAVHLAAGMLAAGYKSVIATMWSIRDEDGPLVAEHVYRHLLKDGTPDFRKASLALHEGIVKLRAAVGEDNFMSWVPYIHMGQ